MSIRGRITLWFIIFSLVSLIFMASVFHYEMEENIQRMKKGLPIDSSWEETGEFLMYFGLPIAIFLLSGGSYLLWRSLKPISQLTIAAENLHLHQLNERIPSLGTGDELDRLISVFNKMTSRLQESFAHVRDFTLHASHELKTPLTIMQGELEASLADENLPAEQREMLGSLLDEVHRLTKIVQNLTFLAKADAGLLSIEKKPVRLDELVHESYTDAQMLARPMAITVILQSCESVVLNGDRHRLRQLLLNLIDNAIKYNELNGRVEMSIVKTESDAILSISNTGPGIPPEKQPRIFERFYRGDPAHGSAVEGCGLGLAIVECIVRSHGGSVKLTSQLGQITIINVSFPIMKLQTD